MASSFLPDADAALLAWSLNFSTKITAAPATYGLVAAQATAYAALHSAYATALAACDPGLRTKSAVLAKNSARAGLKLSAGQLSKIIQGTATVTNAQKAQLGLNVRAQPQPIPPPASAPAVDVLGVSGRTVSLRLHDADNAGRRGKPAGVKGAAVFSFVGDAPPADLADFKFEGNTTRTTIDVAFPVSVPAGAQVWVTAQWFNERAQPGPAAAPVGTNVQFGPMSMAA